MKERKEKEKVWFACQNVVGITISSIDEWRESEINKIENFLSNIEKRI